MLNKAYVISIFIFSLFSEFYCQNLSEIKLNIQFCTCVKDDNPCPYCDCNSIDSIVNVLKAEPSFSIEIASHTDLRGNKNRNLELSIGLANSVRNYLIKNGIVSLRINTKGYGDTQPYIFKNDTIVQNVNIKKGTIINEKFIKTLSNKETKEYFYSLNRRILVKFTYQ